MSKRISSAQDVRSQAAGSTPRLAVGLPAVGAPTPPSGFGLVVIAQPQPAPTSQQVRDVGDVAREIRQPSYAEDFGKRAPGQTEFAESLDRAKGWSNEVASARKWLAYAESQNNGAWTEVMATMRVFGPEFTLAAAHDAEITRRYPQTRDFLLVRKVAAARGVVTRAKDKKRSAAKASAVATNKGPVASSVVVAPVQTATT